MARLGTMLLFFALAPLIYNKSPHSAQTQTSPQSTRQSSPMPPSSPDMPLPDPASFPKRDDKTKPLAKRELDKLTPVCVDGIFHTCLPWGISTAPATSEAEREFAKSFDVGTTYFKGKNYKAAESRFREALEYKPDNADATFMLAESVSKLGRANEAREMYESYLKLSPKGPDADRARKALQKVRKSASAENQR